MRHRGPAEDPQHIAEAVLELVLLLSRAHCGAVFSTSEGEPILVASGGIHQESLAAGRQAWSTQRGEQPGTGPLYFPSALVMPIAVGERRVGYLYADQPQPGFRLSPEQCATFGEILGRALASVPTDGSGPLPALGLAWSVDRDRRSLLTLLEQEEWNISRVARRLGLKRQTIYNRLRRYSIPRQRVPKKAS